MNEQKRIEQLVTRLERCVNELNWSVASIPCSSDCRAETYINYCRINVEHSIGSKHDGDDVYRLSANDRARGPIIGGLQLVNVEIDNKSTLYSRVRELFKHITTISTAQKDEYKKNDLEDGWNDLLGTE